MLALVGRLYAIEREAKQKELDEDALLTLRRERSVPILDEIQTWLDTEGEIVLPRGPLAQAITYARNQWDALVVYATRGFLAIDNNASERALKRVAINWLFAGNDDAAASHARLWSLIASCERQGVDPQRYLTSVLAKLPLLGKGDPEDLEQFLPDVWAKDDAADPSPPANRRPPTS